MGKEKRDQDIRRGLIWLLNTPLLVERSGVMWTEEDKPIQIFPLPKPAPTPHPVFGEGIRDHETLGIKKQETSEEEKIAGELTDTIFVQGKFESDPQGNIQLSTQRVKASVFGFLKLPSGREKRI